MKLHARFRLLIAALSIFLCLPATAQQTLGLFQYDAAASDGYNLFAPMAATTTYLIDNCGREVHRWPGTNPPGAAVYLQPDGLLLRTGRVGSSVFNGGGIGGRMERVDWGGTVTWGYDYVSSTYHQHHDVELLPNGNILVVAWEAKTPTEAAAAGRNPSTSVLGLWPDHLVELEPVGSNGANIVWEWHAWDHLVQDFDNTKANFGVVGDHPELIDVNHTQGGMGGPNGQLDWLHINSVAYNAALDQIVLSVHNLHEFWVIDHSTTTAEAASHSGGNSGKGGDLLYRWGNPQVYDRGTAADQQLFGQHNVHWIPDSLPGGGNFIIFNNGAGRPAGNYSTIEVVTPPAVDAQGNYAIAPGQPYGPASPSWNYTAPTPTDFYSSNISGATRMPNGNTLICSGARGRFFEVDSTGNMVWDYVNPISLGSPLAQGQNAQGNNVFRVERYAPDYPGLQGQTLTPGSPLEINPLPLPAICSTISVTGPLPTDWKAGPIPFDGQLRVWLEGQDPSTVQVWSMEGRLVWQQEIAAGETILETASWAKGIYLLKMVGRGGSMKALKL